MTQFILHIGPHKTATTYIQQTLFALRERLEGRGVHVPVVWSAGPGLPSHMRLVWALREGGTDQIEEDLRRIVASRYDRVVVSCEALSRLEPYQIERLRALLGTSAVRIVYYVRRWSERLPSLWQETVKFGYDATLPEYLLEQLVAPAGPELRDTAMLDRFAAVFGLTEIELVSYSHLVTQNVDIARHFLESVLGISDIAPPVSGRPNPSLPVEDTETIRALNAVHLRRGGERSPALREWYLAHKDALPTVSVSAAIRAHVVALRLDEGAPQFAPIYRGLVGRYGARVIPPRARIGLHVPRMRDVPFVRLDYLLDPGVARRLMDTHEMYWSVIQRQATGGTTT